MINTQMLRSSFKTRKKWKKRDIALLLERLELYVSSGLPIDRALQISGDGTAPKRRVQIERVRVAVVSGWSLSRALSESIGVPQTVAGLIEHGESSGGLAQALALSRALLEREDELKKKCLSAMMYPIVIGVFACGLTIGLMRGVMPQIIPMLLGLHVQLPLLTRIVIFLSENFLAYGGYFVAIALIAAVVALAAYRRCVVVKKISHGLLLRVPLVGSLVHAYSLSVFLRSFGALVESGSPISDAYSSTAQSVAFTSLRSRLSPGTMKIKRGVPIGDVICGKRIPPYVAPLLKAGEASGSLGASIIRAAGIIDHDIELSLKRLTSLIEPVMMVGMGVVVGAIALSIMMPIYDISKVLQK